MVEAAEVSTPFQVVLRTRSSSEAGDEEFFQFCTLNPELQIERTATGEIILMSPEGGSSSSGNVELTTQFQIWAKRDGTGRVFGSSAGFILPNKATRSPDVAWVTKARLRTCPEAWQRFLPLCPDFVLELRSPTDSLPKLQEKMEEYAANGARLGWLIDPQGRQVFSYRPGQPCNEFDDPEQMFGQEVLPGFVLQMADFWEAWEGER